MTIEINSPKLTPAVATYGAFAVRKSDGFRWNNAAQAWQASPSNADSFIALTDRGGVNAGLYRGSNSGDMGDAGLVEITMHDSASSYALVAGTGAGTITVMGGDEVQTALVGSAMTLAPDAVNAAALAADAVAEIDAQLTASHGSGSWNPDGGVIGPGADPVTVRVLIADEPVPDADVWVTSDEEGDTTVAGTLQTDSSGLAVFMLDYGSTYYLWAQKDGVNAIRGQEFVASAN